MVISPESITSSEIALQRENYLKELDQFNSSPEIVVLTGGLQQIQARLTELGEHQKEFILLETARSPELWQQFKDAERAANRTRSLYQRDYHTLKACAYRFLGLIHLQPLAERLYPLDTTQNRCGEVRQEISAQQRENAIEERLTRQEQDRLQQQKKQLSQQVQSVILDWVLQDRDRVLFYALDHLMDDAWGRGRLFRRFAQPLNGGAETALRALQQQYDSMVSKNDTESPQPPQPEAGIKIVREEEPTSSPEDFDDPVHWSGWGLWFGKNGSNHHQIENLPEASDKETNTYKIGVLQKMLWHSSVVRFLTEQELASFLAKRAEKLVPNDQRMLADVRAIVASLQENPYGPGTKVLKDKTIKIGSKTLPLRSLAPDRRGHSLPPLQHELSADLRMVYAVYGTNGQRAVVLDGDGIYKHEEYDNMYK